VTFWDDAVSACFDTDEAGVEVIDKGVKEAHGIGSSTDAGD